MESNQIKYIIDTGSLLSFVRYYLCFDKSKVLYSNFEKKILNGEYIIIDKVCEECECIAGGLIYKKLIFFNDDRIKKSKNFSYKTSELLPLSPKKFFNQLNNQFVNSLVRKRITDDEFEKSKFDFLGSADMRMIILCQNLINKNEEVALVTEETPANNDNKVFRKIPQICETLKIRTLTLPKLIEESKEVNIHIDS